MLSLLSLSQSLRMVENDLDDVLADTTESAELAPLILVEESLPGDDLSVEKVLDRCSASRGKLLSKSILGYNFVIGGTQPAMELTWHVSWIASLITALWKGPYVIFGVSALASITTDTPSDLSNKDISFLLGVNRSTPSCCCPNSKTAAVDGSLECHLVGAKTEAGVLQAVCPADWTHDPSGCATVEIDTFGSSTVEGCHCNDAMDCKVKPLYDGHAWCGTPENCGHRHEDSHWDFCLHQEVTVDLEEAGEGLVNGPLVNGPLAKFQPNVPRRGLSKLLPRADALLKFGVRTDGARGVATARSGPLSRRECFAALPEETLNGCAQRCLDEGAQNAQMMTAGVTDVAGLHKCVAFAYERSKHLCVTLPHFARRAEFFERLKHIDGEGWQNFILRGEL